MGSASGYRLQRDDATGFQGLHCPFLPSAGLVGTTQVCRGVELGSWDVDEEIDMREASPGYTT